MSAAPVDTVGPGALGGRQATVRPFRVLVAGILSAQTKDQVVAEAVNRLDGLDGGLCVNAILSVPGADLADMLHGVSFHKRKAQYLKAVASRVAECGGQVPQSVRELMELPGVGPKIAHLVMQVAFGKVEGIVVDTHVHRICNALGWASGRTPEQTRRALEAWLPRSLWAELNPLLVGLGQSARQRPLELAEACGRSSDRLLARKLALGAGVSQKLLGTLK